MQYAVAGEHFQRSVIHPDGNVQGDFLAGIFQVTVKALLESQFVRGHFKARFRVLVDIHLFRYWEVRHARFSFGSDNPASVSSNGVTNLSSLDSRAESMLRLRQLFFCRAKEGECR